VLLLLRDRELVFRPVPARCSIDYCRDQARAIVALTGGFTPGGVVRTEIFTPSSKNANDIGGLGTYREEKPINEDGQFIWWYWWDPGMEIGVYHVRITDEATGRSIEADFEFY
jgi:hypothetical protein